MLNAAEQKISGVHVVGLRYVQAGDPRLATDMYVMKVQV